MSFVKASSLGRRTPFAQTGSEAAEVPTPGTAAKQPSLQTEQVSASGPRPGPLPSYSRGRICFGNCGWSDAGAPWNNSANASALALPNGSTSLHRYAHSFYGCVEVDSTTYNYPLASTVKNWVTSTPDNFIFHIKLFGFLCSRGGQFRSLPRAVREIITDASPGRVSPTGWIRMQDVPKAAVKKLWDMSNDMLGPLIQANKLGVVLLQFHSNFSVTNHNYGYVRYCRRMLRSDVRMAVEFRDRSWILPGSAQLNRTIEFLSSLPFCCLVASDDLKHELERKPLDQGKTPTRLEPVVRPTESMPELVYCRVHRRRGSKRLLSDEALHDWISRLEAVVKMPNNGNDDDHHHREDTPKNSNATVYFLWGTDHKDQQVLNAQKMKKMLPERLRADWRLQVRQSATSKRGSLLNMLLSSNAEKSTEKTSSATLFPRRKSLWSSAVSEPQKNPASSMLAFVKASGSQASEKPDLSAERKRKKVFRFSSTDLDSGFAVIHKKSVKRAKSTDGSGKRSISSFFTKT